MPIAVDPLKVCQSIAALLRADHEHVNNLHRFAIRGSVEATTFELSDTWFDEIAARLGGNTQAIEDTGMASARLIEVLVSEESRFGSSRLFRDSPVFEVSDAENGLAYRLGPPTDELLVFVLNRLADIAPPAALRSAIVGFRVRRILDGHEPQDVLSLVRAAVPRLLTCRVESQQPRTAADLSAHANALLFQLTYNLNVALVEMRSLDEFVRSGRLASMRRARANEIEPPRRVYVQDLTYHYQLGVSSESPVLEFLSFYHVAEHFFESVFQDDLIDTIRERITRPDFSTKRKKDVHGLIREINKRQRIRDDAITFSEQEALRLTLLKYVPLDNLVDKLASYDKVSTKYFEESSVSFCEGDRIPFSSQDPREVFAAMARRVYRIRNAIVHSKDGEKSRFVPFEHDDELAKEVPLMRFLAEEVIIATSARV